MCLVRLAVYALVCCATFKFCLARGIINLQSVGLEASNQCRKKSPLQFNEIDQKSNVNIKRTDIVTRFTSIADQICRPRACTQASMDSSKGRYTFGLLPKTTQRFSGLAMVSVRPTPIMAFANRKAKKLLADQARREEYADIQRDARLSPSKLAWSFTSAAFAPASASMWDAIDVYRDAFSRAKSFVCARVMAVYMIQYKWGKDLLIQGREKVISLLHFDSYHRFERLHEKVQNLKYQVKSTTHSALETVRSRVKSSNTAASETQILKEQTNELLQGYSEYLLNPSYNWKLVIEKEDGTKVWKAYAPKDADGADYPIIKSHGIVNAPAADLVEMMIDSERVQEYNRFSKGRTDVQTMGEDTKVVWNRTWPPMTPKPHDFCTLMHVTKNPKDGSYAMLTKAIQHPKVPKTKGFIRSRIVCGAMFFKPVPGDPSKTELTSVNHVVSCGLPICIVDKASPKSAADFIQNVAEVFN